MDVDTVFILEIFDVEFFDVRQAFFHSVNLGHRADQLQGIQITGQKTGFNPLFFGLDSESTHDVISLVIIDFVKRPTKCVQ